jgi:hypothetical protein
MEAGVTQHGDNAGKSRHSFVLNHAPRGSNHLVDRFDIPRMHDPPPSYSCDRKRRMSTEQLSSIDNPFQAEQTRAQTFCSHSGFDRAGFGWHMIPHKSDRSIYDW